MNAILDSVRANFDRLGIRLAIVLAIALLPLMIVSIVRSNSVVNEALSRSQAALIGETLRAVRQEVILIERAKAVAQSVSTSVPIWLDDPDLCSQQMLKMLDDNVFSFVGFYDVTGHVPCSSAPAPFDFGPSATLDRQIADPKMSVMVNEEAPASGTSVIYASYPVFDNDSTLLGFTGVSVPHSQLRSEEGIVSDATFLTLNASGVVLTGPGSLDAAKKILPQFPEAGGLDAQPTSFRAFGQDGNERLYALVPVAEGELFALSSWPLESGINRGFYLRNPALFPALMWLASLGVAWFAASLFVTRHVIKLRRAIRNFADTRKTITASQFDAAPKELRDFADTFAGMTDTILQDEAQIEDAMRQKDILLREVHHRVKNNLQLIASIMSMQMRQSRSDEVRQLMQSLHDRVNSLATIHRNLYQTTGQADISMDEHLNTIVNQVVRMASAKRASIDLQTKFDKVRMNPDQAVPLSLFVTEAVTNAIKYIGAPEGEKATLRVTLEVLDKDQAIVKVTNSMPAEIVQPDAEKSSGLGSELMDAFSDQLDGTFTATPSGGMFNVLLAFTIEELDAKD